MRNLILHKSTHFLEKRQEPFETPSFQLILIIAAVVVAFLIGSLFFLPFGVNPIKAYYTMVAVAFGDLQGIAFTIIRATPLLLVGLAAIISWRTGFTYLGFDSAMYIGAITGTWFALQCGETGMFAGLTFSVFFPVAILISALCGGFWVAIVAFCKVRLGGNEIIMSLMSNYIAIYLISYLTAGPMREPGQMPQTYHIPPSTVLSFIIPNTRVHSGVLLVIFFVFFTYLLLNKTRLGYEMIASGANLRAARYSGINVSKTVLIAALISGSIAGIAGLIEVLGVQYRVLLGITKNLGFIGIVCALLGRLNPFGLILSSFLYAGMNVGSEAMQRASGIPTSVILTIQGLIVMLLFVFDVLRTHRIVWPFVTKYSEKSLYHPSEEDDRTLETIK